MTADASRLAALDRLRESNRRFADGFLAEDTAGATAMVEDRQEERLDNPIAEPTRSVVYDHGFAFLPVPLRFPFAIGDQRVTELVFAQPAFADVEAALLGHISEMDLHARMAGVPVDVLRALKWEDSERATLIARALAPEMQRSGR